MKKKLFAPMGYLVLASVLVVLGVGRVKWPDCLSGEEIAELREQYPVYENYQVDPGMAYPMYSYQREAVETMDSVVYAEVVEGGTPPRPVIRILRDTEGVFQPGEECSLSVGGYYAPYTAQFPVGTRIAVPMKREDRPSHTLRYEHLSVYYVIEDKYLLSVYPDRVFRGETNFTGRTLEDYWTTCKLWKRFPLTDWKR